MNKFFFRMDGNQKYKSQSCRCLSHHWHRSKKEATHCNKLLADVQDRRIRSYKPEVEFRLYSNGKYICSHRVDFLVELNNSKTEVHEVKGFKTRDWRIKRKLFIANYPTIEYKVFS
jgi:hypothetical protein